MHESMEMYRYFVCSIHRLNFFIKQLLDHELQLLDDRLIFTDLMALYYFSDDNPERQKDKYHEGMLGVAKHMASMGYIKIQPNTDPILTEQGKIMRDHMDTRFTHHAKNLMFKGLMMKELSHILTILSRFESFWSFLLSVKTELKNDRAGEINVVA